MAKLPSNSVGKDVSVADLFAGPDSTAMAANLGAALDVPTPETFSTVQSPELPKRPIHLQECIAIALEKGRTGMFFDNSGGRRTSVTGVNVRTDPVQSTDSIRVFALEPARAAASIEEALSRFDAWTQSGINWQRIDQRNRFLGTQTSFDELNNRSQLDAVGFQSGIFRNLPTGGVAGVDFQTNYENNFLTSSSGILNPAYRPSLQFTFEQPLLQGAGVWINQVRDLHPGSIKRKNYDTGRAPGILLVRVTQRQAQLEFERMVQELVFRVEEAYWKLYCAYWELHSATNGMTHALEAWQIAKARFDAGGIGVEDLAMIEEQYHFFRNLRIEAMGRGRADRPGVLEAERYLRYVVGLPAEDGQRLVPADPLDFLHYDPPLALSIAQAKTFRPEIRQVEQEIEGAHFQIAKAQDRLKPDLRFVSSYGINALGGDLGDGLSDFAKHPRHGWELGLQLVYPIGRRSANAEVLRAQLALNQRIEFLKDQKEKLVFSLQRSYQDLVQAKLQYQARQSQRDASVRQLRARIEKFRAGGDPKQPGAFIDLLLRAQRNWVDSLREEYSALCEFRVAIADFERQKGTICDYENVTVHTSGSAPANAVVGASAALNRWSARNDRPNSKVEPSIPPETFPSSPDSQTPPMSQGSAPVTTHSPSNELSISPSGTARARIGEAVAEQPITLPPANPTFVTPEPVHTTNFHTLEPPLLGGHATPSHAPETPPLQLAPSAIPRPTLVSPASQRPSDHSPAPAASRSRPSATAEPPLLIPASISAGFGAPSLREP